MTIVELHNLFREMEGLKPLEVNDILTFEAEKHAKFMARRNWLNDFKQEERITRLSQWFENIKENIMLGNNEETAIKKLINFPENREKIMSDCTHIGYGSYQSKIGIKYWCILTGKIK